MPLSNEREIFASENRELNYGRNTLQLDDFLEDNFGLGGENFYDQSLENKPPSPLEIAQIQSSTITESIAEDIGGENLNNFISADEPIGLLDPNSQFSRDLFEFLGVINRSNSNSGNILKTPLMTRSNSINNGGDFPNMNSNSGSRQQSPASAMFHTAQKHALLQREDSLNEVMHLIKNEDTLIGRPGSLNIKGGPNKELEPWLSFLKTTTPTASPVGEGPMKGFPHPEPSSSTLTDGQTSIGTTTTATPPPDSFHGYAGVPQKTASPLVPERKSPQPKSNLEWETNINGVTIKLEPQQEPQELGPETNYIFDDSQASQDPHRPASAAPVTSHAYGSQRPSRPFSVSSLPPTVPRGRSTEDFETLLTIPERRPSPRKTTRKRKIKTEFQFSDEDVLGELPPPRKYSRKKPEMEEEEDYEEWRKKRDRNNDAVRRARAKKKIREMQTEQKCEALEEEVDRLTKELDAERAKRIKLEEILEKLRPTRKHR